MKARVIFIPDAPDDMVRSMHMTPAHSIEEALSIAEGMFGRSDAAVIVIPDGVSVIVGR